MNTLQFKVKNVQKFIGFLQKFSSVDQGLILEIKNEKLVGKTTTREKTVIKYSSIDQEEIFENAVSETLKVGIVNIQKLCNAMKYFGDEFNFSVEYDQEGIGEGAVNVAKQIIMNDDNIEITLPCGKLQLFIDIPDDKMDAIASIEDPIATFAMTKDVQAKLNALNALDNDDKMARIKFVVANGEVTAQCKSFKYKLGNAEGTISIAIYKTLYNHVDKDENIAYVQDGKIVFVSNESDTKTVVGETEE